jgi:hypothetical protein
VLDNTLLTPPHTHRRQEHLLTEQPESAFWDRLALEGNRVKGPLGASRFGFFVGIQNMRGK